jgi:hypothetical protein
MLGALISQSAPIEDPCCAWALFAHCHHNGGEFGPASVG